MNILFLSLLDINTLSARGIYQDLLRCLAVEGHRLYVVSPAERRSGLDTHVIHEDGTVILRPRIGNIQKTNLIEKGITTVTLEPVLIKIIKKHFAGVRFDLVLYATPPVTFCRVVEYIKNRDGACAYLLLKDIFPQNSVDLGMISSVGPIYKAFRRKERRLYAVSDRIGCMSPANAEYLLNHNPEISPDRVEVCPNSLEIDENVAADGGIPGALESTRTAIRAKYKLPADHNTKIFLYGGNLGRPQAIPHVIECLKTQAGIPGRHFVIAGTGTETHLLREFAASGEMKNFTLLPMLSHDEFDTLASVCDYGMLFLDFRFTIPNFPSRLLSYMQAGLPVLASTDAATDVGSFLEENRIGVACLSDSTGAFAEAADRLVNLEIPRELVRRVLREKFDVRDACRKILSAYEACNENRR